MDMKKPDSLRSFVPGTTTGDGNETLAFAAHRTVGVTATAHAKGITMVALKNGDWQDVPDLVIGRNSVPPRATAMVFHREELALTFVHGGRKLYTCQPGREFW
jgi:hypothetical protein